jgi:8-oxo-dGTP pyrophosphatase MutT (NUDIX family)
MSAKENMKIFPPPIILKETICINYMPSINIWIVKENLRQLLSQRQKQHIVDASRVSSAVLVPIYIKQGQAHILFIKRTEKVKEHKGQISFPGGTYEEGDITLLDTALRECTEEIGLHAEDVDVLGELDDEVTTTSNYLVSPFVTAIPWPYQFKINKDEVEEIIEVPILALLDRNCLQQDTELLDGKVVDSYAYYYQGRVIWGATARILNRFLDIFIQAMSNK